MRVLFDECLAGPSFCRVRDHAAVATPGAEVSSIPELRKSGKEDADWIPEAVREGWCIVSADNGRSTNGRKLPRVCDEAGATYALVSSAVHAMKQGEKAEVIIAVWADLVRLMAAHPAGKLRVGLDNQRRPVVEVLRSGRAR